MFRKPFSVKSQSQIKSSEKRKLKQDILKKYPNCTSQELDTLLPNKNPLIQVKITTHNGTLGVIYIDQSSQPLFFHLAHHDAVLPTIYTCWEIPSFAPGLVTNRGAFSRIADGADLMLPGVFVEDKNEFPDFNVKDVLMVKLYPDNIPVGIGYALVNSQDFQDAGFDLKGKACEVIHTYGDTLWGMGDRSHPVAREEFLDATSAADGDEAVEQQILLNEQRNQDEAVEVIAYNDGEESYVDKRLVDSSIVEMMNQMKISQSLLSLENEDANLQKEKSDSKSTVSKEEMDSFLEFALFNAIKTLIPEKACPISASVLYDSYMIPARSSGSHLDMKQSSYKKMNKFLKVYEKKGILKMKEKANEIQIVSFHRQHPILTDFVEEEVKITHKSVSNPPETPSYPVMEITALYKPWLKAVSLFESGNISEDTYMTSKQVRSFIEEYVKFHDLIDKSMPKFIKLDDTLTDLLLNKNEFGERGYLQRHELTDRLLRKLQPFYQISYVGNSDPSSLIIKKGEIPSIEIILQSRGGKKTTTTIRGLTHLLIDPKAFADALKQVCASSSSLDDVPGKPTDVQVMVQGNKVKQVFSCLRNFGLPCHADGMSSAFVNITNKLSKKK